MQKVRSTARARLVGARDFVALVWDAISEALHYQRIAGPGDSAVTSRIKGPNREAQLTKDYHRVEKGHALANPKVPFGADTIRRLELLLDAESDDSKAEQLATDALESLRVWNEGDASMRDRVAPVVSQEHQSAEWPLQGFFDSRYSLRDFDTDRKVNHEVIKAATKYASNTPSVCNRQAGRLHIFEDEETIKQMLSLQGGSSGFMETVRTLGVVTTKTSLFTGPRERNQRFIDGSLFAMTLVWAFHAKGVGSCMLNWSKFLKDARTLRSITNIPADEDVVCLIALGYPREGEVRRALSTRRTADEFLRIH